MSAVKPHLIAVALLAYGISAFPQPTFKAGARTVAVYATVTDQSGRLLADLTRDNFEVDDNGKPQAISIFANDVQPITVVMLLDRSGSMRANFELVEKAAEVFVEEMHPADKARIGSFSNRIQVDPRDFTSSREELIEILRTQLQEEGPTPLWNAINVGITALLRQQGRRVILVFTDGADRPMNDKPHNNSLKGVMRRAEEEDVMVYAVGLAGVNPHFTASPGGWPRRGRGGFGGFGSRRLSAVADKPDEGLAKIAAATGGGYFELTSAADLAATFKRVAEELHHQYVLGFTPAALDGKMHKLDVRVKGGTASVRARKSYRATVER